MTLSSQKLVGFCRKLQQAFRPKNELVMHVHTGHHHSKYKLFKKDQQELRPAILVATSKRCWYKA